MIVALWDRLGWSPDATGHSTPLAFDGLAASESTTAGGVATAGSLKLGFDFSNLELMPSTPSTPSMPSSPLSPRLEDKVESGDSDMDVVPLE